MSNQTTVRVMSPEERTPLQTIVGTIGWVLVVAICVWGMVQCRSLATDCPPPEPSDFIPSVPREV